MALQRAAGSLAQMPLHHAGGASASLCLQLWGCVGQSTFTLCYLPADTEASQMQSAATWLSFCPSPRRHKLTTRFPLLAAGGEGLEQGASTQPVKDAFCPRCGTREMCGCADRPGKSWFPPASPPVTSSRSTLLIYSTEFCVPAGVPGPRAGKHLPGAEAGGCKRGGKG